MRLWPILFALLALVCSCSAGASSNRAYVISKSHEPAVETAKEPHSE